ncbi:MAG: hypothetical protein GEV11_28600 [Streptosporangiales bacterium]|nr:hypothetical protein [Streptosporangiales bacterium]
MQGLLFVLSQPKDGDEAEFHDWYDNEHAPARTALDGIDTGYRYRAADGERPEWLAYYDLDLGVLDTLPYRRLLDQRSEREKGVIARLTAFDRRVYEHLDDQGTPPAGPPPMVVARWLEAPPEHEEELLAWYGEEHIPLLLRTPGWNRCRRFQLREGGGPKLLVLHEIDGPAVFDTDTYRAATDTPWRDKIMTVVTGNERRRFTFHRAF